MEYSQKMVLVPHEVYGAIKFNSGRSKNDCKLEDSEKMHNILEDHKLPLDHKMNPYNQELQTAIDTKQKVDQAPVAEEDMHNHHYHHDGMIEYELIQEGKVKLHWNYITKHKTNTSNVVMPKAKELNTWLDY